MCPACWAAPETTVPRPPASGRHTPSHQPIGTAVLPPDSVVSPLAQTLCPGPSAESHPTGRHKGSRPMEAQAELGLRTVRCRPPYEEVRLLRRLGHRLRQPPMGRSTSGIVDGQAHRVRPQLSRVLPNLEHASPRHRPTPRGRRQRAGLRCLGVRGGGCSVIGGRHRRKMRSMTMWLGSFIMLFPALCKGSVAGSPSTRRSSTAGAFHQDQGEERLSSCKTCHQFPPLHRKAGAPRLARRERLGMMPPQASPQPR